VNQPFEDYSNPPTPPTPPAPPVIRENLVSPVVTYTLVVVTVVIYLLQIGTNAVLGRDLPAVLGMKVNQYIMMGQIWRLVTPMLLHGSILHIGFNMYALVVIGSELERRFGHGRFLLLYILGSFAGNVMSFLISPNPSLGATTSIFGLLGAEIVFFYKNRKLFGPGASRGLQQAVWLAGINLLLGLSPGIDNWGHLGGLFGGLMFTWFAGPKLAVQGVYPTLEVVDQHELQDQILGASLVILVFGALAMAKMFGFIPS
jgi:rhomboid protease GluP